MDEAPPRCYRQGIKRQRLYRRAEIENLLRVVPSTAETKPGRRSPSREWAEAEIPLAESWIRD